MTRFAMPEAAQLRAMQPRVPFRVTFERDGAHDFVDLSF